MAKQARELKEVSCRDTGVECDFMVRAYTIEEIVEHVAIHAKTMHGWKGFPEQLYLQMRKVVRTVDLDES